MNDLYLFDEEYRSACGSLAGLDEAGRGPLAGPLVACAVILPADFHSDVLTDSKKLTDPVRRELKKLIEDSALGISLGIVTHSEIDGNRMSWAVRTAFRRAMAPLSSKAGVFLVDGNGVPGLEYPCRFIVKGDSKSLSIAAASVVAKVTRDDMMLRAHTEYPKYGFNRHKGYGTREHIAAIESLGPCPIHRMSFEPLRTMFQTGQLTLFPREARGPGRAAEGGAAEYYQRLGFTVLCRNWRCPQGEIDLILSRGDTVVFVEVKSSFTGFEEMALHRVTPGKVERISRAASVWLANEGFTGPCRLECLIVSPGGMEAIPIPYLDNNPSQ